MTSHVLRGWLKQQHLWSPLEESRCNTGKKNVMLLIIIFYKYLDVIKTTINSMSNSSTLGTRCVSSMTSLLLPLVPWWSINCQPSVLFCSVLFCSVSCSSLYIFLILLISCPIFFFHVCTRKWCISIRYIFLLYPCQVDMRLSI